MSETERTEKRIALVIGIGHYTHYHPLQYSPPSAEDVYDLLVSPKFGKCDPQLSIKKIIQKGQTLSLSELEDIVTQAIERVESGDQFFFYFCGHGKIYGNDLFLILPETPEKSILHCYDFRNLVRKLKLARVNKAICIVDACHSGAMFSSIEELMGDLKPELPKGFAFMAASGKFQYARQQAEIERTIFSHYFCEGIKNWKEPRSEHITLSELKEYINKQVKERHPEAEQSVHTLIQEGDDSIWVSYNPAYNKETEMIDFKQKIAESEDLFNKEVFKASAWESVKTIEQALKYILTQNLERVDEEVRRKVQKAVQKRDKRGEGIDKLTMGSLVRVIEESKFFDAWARAMGKDPKKFFQILQIINLHKLVQLRNKFAHEDQRADRTEAEWLLSSVKLLLKTFEIISPEPDPEKEEQKSTTHASGYVRLYIERDIKGFNETTRNNLIKTIAALLNIDSQSVGIFSVSPGSIQVVIELPFEAAQKLVALFQAKSEPVVQFICQFSVTDMTILKDEEIAQLSPQPLTIPAPSLKTSLLENVAERIFDIFDLTELQAASAMATTKKVLTKGQTEDETLRWQVVKDEEENLIIRFNSRKLKEGIRLHVKGGDIHREVELKQEASDQVGAKILFNPDELPRRGMLSVEIVN